MEEELFALKWNNHQSTFLKIIKNLRFKNLHTDATLACDGKFFSVHKFVLATCSNYFNDIFNQTSCKSPVVILKDIDCKNLEYLLDYMYIGEINVKQNELASLVSVAECLKIKGLAVPDEDPDVTCTGNPSYNQSGNLNKKSVPKTSSPPSNNVQPHTENDVNMELGFVSESIKYEKDTDVNIFNKEDESNAEDLPLSKIKLEANNEFVLSVSDNHDQVSGLSKVLGNNVGVETEAEKALQEYYHQERNKGVQDIIPGVNDLPSSSQLMNLQHNNDWVSNRIQELSGDFSSQILSSESHVGSSVLLGSHQLSKSYGLKRLKRKLSQLKSQKSPFGIKVNYICPHCTYSCNDKSNFKRHVQTHTGEKPYHCPFCRYSSIHSSNLKTHIRNKHSSDLTKHSLSSNFGFSNKSHVGNSVNMTNFNVPSPVQTSQL